MRFENKILFATGGGSGLAAATATRFTEEGGWHCAACTSVDPHEALPLGAREHLRALRTLPVEEAPDPGADAPARAVTELLRDRLLREMGGRLRSYEVLLRMLA